LDNLPQYIDINRHKKLYESVVPVFADDQSSLFCFSFLLSVVWFLLSFFVYAYKVQFQHHVEGGGGGGLLKTPKRSGGGGLLFKFVLKEGCCF